MNNETKTCINRVLNVIKNTEDGKFFLRALRDNHKFSDFEKSLSEVLCFWDIRQECFFFTGRLTVSHNKAISLTHCAGAKTHKDLFRISYLVVGKNPNKNLIKQVKTLSKVLDIKIITEDQWRKLIV